MQGEGVSCNSSTEAEVLTLYSNGIDANLWESGDISLVLFHPSHYISLWTHLKDPPPIRTQLSPGKSRPFGERELNIGGDGKRGSGGMATALTPFLCLAIFPPLFLWVFIYCDDHSSLSSTTAVQKWIISYILHIISLLTGDMNSINWPRSQCVAS